MCVKHRLNVGSQALVPKAKHSSPLKACHATVARSSEMVGPSRAKPFLGRVPNNLKLHIFISTHLTGVMRTAIKGQRARRVGARWALDCGSQVCQNQVCAVE